MNNLIKIQDDILLANRIINARKDKNILRISYDTSYDRELYVYVFPTECDCEEMLKDIWNILSSCWG